MKLKVLSVVGLALFMAQGCGHSKRQRGKAASNVSKGGKAARSGLELSKLGLEALDACTVGQPKVGDLSKLAPSGRLEMRGSYAQELTVAAYRSDGTRAVHKNIKLRFSWPKNRGECVPADSEGNAVVTLSISELGLRFEGKNTPEMLGVKEAWLVVDGKVWNKRPWRLTEFGAPAKCPYYDVKVAGLRVASPLTVLGAKVVSLRIDGVDFEFPAKARQAALAELKRRFVSIDDQKATYPLISRKYKEVGGQRLVCPSNPLIGYSASGQCSSPLGLGPGSSLKPTRVCR